MTRIVHEAGERGDLAAGAVRLALDLARQAGLVAHWLHELLGESGVAAELAAGADARGITLAEAFAPVAGPPAGPAREPAHA